MMWLLVPLCLEYLLHLGSYQSMDLKFFIYLLLLELNVSFIYAPFVFYMPLVQNQMVNLNVNEHFHEYKKNSIFIYVIPTHFF